MSLFSLLRPSAPQVQRGAWNDFGDRWFAPGGGAVTQDLALTLSAVWACQTLIADSIASMPVDTYRKQGDQRIPTAPPLFLTTPNPINTRVDYETQRILSLLGWGNAVSVLIRHQNGTVLERYLIDPRSVTYPRRVGDDYLIDGRAVPAGNIQHIRGYMAPGRLVGMSVIANAQRSMNLAVTGEDTATNLMGNGISASGVLTIPQMPAETSSSIVDRLRDQFASRHAGSGSAGKPIVLTGGTTWSQTSIDPADAQFLESRKFQIEEIARWYRVPLHEIQHIADHASQGGGNGIEAQSQNLVRRTLLPWTVRLEQADSLLIPRGQFVKFNVDGFLRADIKTRFEVYATGITWGVLSPNEARAFEDMQPREGGDEFIPPPNMTADQNGPASQEDTPDDDL